MPLSVIYVGFGGLAFLQIQVFDILIQYFRMCYIKERVYGVLIWWPAGWDNVWPLVSFKYIENSVYLALNI